ncbi:MAG: hypothetical protein ABJF11_10640 [Reichenbachiella sp.]|uniref:hypothetical protein n=1 Tax=Reichenbachiella sp. TaxID=2184521 RepID=UPI003267FABC
MIDWILTHGFQIGFGLVLTFGLIILWISNREINEDNTNEVRNKSYGLKFLSGIIFLICALMLIRMVWF